MPTVIKLRNKTAGAGADCKPCQAAREQNLRDAESRARPTLPEDTPASAPVTWSGPIIFEGQMTGDGRYIEPNALTWDNLPIPLRWAREDTGEHNGAVVVGRILAIERRPSGVIWGTGDFDTVHDDSVEAARQVREHLSNGVSADLDNVSFEVRVARELLEGEGVPGEPADAAVDENGRVTVLDIGADDEVMDIDDARIRAATLVAVPAFAGARIELADDDVSSNEDNPDVSSNEDKGTTPDGDPCSCDDDDPAFDPDCRCADPEDTAPDDEEEDDLVAAASPTRPPAAWFTDPNLPELTPLTITDDGRIFGHLAAWDSCHTGFAQTCVAPPRSPSAYSYFRTGSLITADAGEIPVGHITLDTFHAGKRLGPADTIAHYEHTGATVADVAAGEDNYGIWVAGALRHNLSDDQLRTLRSSPLSGDWRRIGGQLELVAALAVNVPGFPVPRAQGLVASSGAVQSLVASGMVVQAGTHIGNSTGPHIPFYSNHGRRTEDDISGEALAWLQKMVEPQHRKAKAALLRRRVRYAQLTRRVQNVR